MLSQLKIPLPIQIQIPTEPQDIDTVVEDPFADSDSNCEPQDVVDTVVEDPFADSDSSCDDTTAFAESNGSDTEYSSLEYSDIDDD